MIKKKRFLFKMAVVTAMLCNGAFINAQVTIGADKNPETFSLLELISGNDKGLRLPQMTTDERNAMADAAFKANTEAQGLQIFNISTQCVETWNGSVWISECLCEAPEQPGEITGKTVAQPGETGLVYSVDKVEDVSYEWELPTGWRQTGGGTSNNITVTASDNYGPGVITVTPSRSCGEGPASTFWVSVGCGAYTDKGEWMVIMCYNLGTAASVQAMTPDELAAVASDPTPTAAGSTDPTIYGDLYQWGRQPDKHQFRNNPGMYGGGRTGVIGYDPNSQIPIGDPWYGIYIWFLGGSGTLDWHGNSITEKDDDLWDFSKYPANNPCPSGWRIASQAEWISIYNSGKTNTWQWAPDVNSSYYPGRLVTPAGFTHPTLFLPAAGVRGGAGGTLGNSGTDGYYWTTTPSPSSSGTTSYNIRFISASVSTTNSSTRASAMSIRCVAN